MVRRHWRACWVQPWTPKLGLVKRIGSQPCAEEEWTAPARAATIPTRAAVRGICVRDASPMIDLLTCASSSPGWREDRTKPALEECRVDRTRVDEAHHTVGPDEHGGGQCNQTVAASGFSLCVERDGKGDGELADESADIFRILLVGQVHRQHLQSCLPIGLIRVDEQRHFLTAGRTPGGPEVDDYRPPPEGREAHNR